ncbi:MAG: isochorismatase family cysteine hydrolase [Burkholderiales bacterium]
MLSITCDHDRQYEFDPAHTALMVIDMQRDFMDPKGYGAVCGEDVSPMQEIVPACQSVLSWARAQGLTIIHTREGHRPDLSDLTAFKQFRNAGLGVMIGAPGPLGRLLVRGEYGHDFIDQMQPLPGEHIVDKPGYGAFHATDLQAILTAACITHLILFGVTTECCVFSTLREAVDRGYWCLTVRDCCAAYDKSWHDATFTMISCQGHLFGSSAVSTAVVGAHLPLVAS